MIVLNFMTSVYNYNPTFQIIRKYHTESNSSEVLFINQNKVIQSTLKVYFMTASLAIKLILNSQNFRFILNPMNVKISTEKE